MNEEIKINKGVQPYQIDLFREVTSEFYTNSFTFYELLPKYVVVRGKDAIKLNADGSVKPVVRFFSIKNVDYKLIIQPAYVENSDGLLVAKFPGVTEEVIEFALYKLAIEDGYLADNTNGVKSFSLITTIYKIYEELKKYNRTRSYEEIRESLNILALTKYSLTSNSEGIDDYKFSPIADAASKSFILDEEDNKVDTALLIRFNSLVNTELIKTSWKQINYDIVMKHQSFLGRWLLKHIQHNFLVATTDAVQKIKLSTIIERSGISNKTVISTTKGNVLDILNGLDKFLQTPIYFEDKKIINPKSNRKVLSDVVFHLKPSKRMVDTIIQNNVMAKKNKMHRIGSDGELIKDPSQVDFTNYKEKSDHHTAFDEAKPIID